MTSRWVSTLCFAVFANSAEASAICFERASSSERARSSIKGATRISVSNASRARSPRSCLSLTLLRLKLTRDIVASPPPAGNLPVRVHQPFPELGKIRHTSAIPRPSGDMAQQIPLATGSDSAHALAAVEQEILRACSQARRDRAEVTLIAVSKTFGPEMILPIIVAGQRVFGENRVQEAKAKWPALMSERPGIALHLIGPLQSNKAKEAVALFDAIHSVDRPSICEALAREINSQNKRP